MEDKVQLYNSSGVKIGETYARRAKQLVKQQRALWIDESCCALRFISGMENLDVNDTNEAVKDADKPAVIKSNDDWLINLAKRKLRERKLFIFHSVSFIPVFFLLYLVLMLVLDGGSYLTMLSMGLIMGLTMGSWATAYVAHAYFFIKNRRIHKVKQFKNERMERLLAKEVSLLQREFTK